MSGMWNRTLVYLGLREEAEETYEESATGRFVPEDDPHAEHAPPRRNGGSREISGDTGVRDVGAGEVLRGAGRDSAVRGRDETLDRERGRAVGRAREERGPGPQEERTEELRPVGRDARTGSTRGAEPGPERRVVRPGRPGPVEEPEETNVRPLRTGDSSLRGNRTSVAAHAALVEVEAFEDVEAIGARYRTGQPVLFDATGADAATARRVVDFVSGLTYGLRGRLTKVGSRAFLLVPQGVELPAEEQRRLVELGYRLPVGSEA